MIHGRSEMTLDIIQPNPQNGNCHLPIFSPTPFERTYLMNLRADLSFYPLNADFIPPIKDLIERLQARSEIDVTCNPLSTQISGDYDDVMRVVAEETKRTMACQHGILVAKFIGGESR